jgi:hypothetical protein
MGLSCLEPVSKFLFIMGLQPVVIPAEAGIHAFMSSNGPRLRGGGSFFKKVLF